MWPLLENIGQLPRVSREAYGIDLTLTLKLKYLVLIWIYWHKNNRATSRHLSYLASPPQFESDSNVHQKNHRFRSQNFYPEVWRLQERRRIITLEQNTLSIFSHYDKTYPKHFIRSQQTTLTTHFHLAFSLETAGRAQDHYIRTKHVKYFFTLRQNVSKTFPSIKGSA